MTYLKNGARYRECAFVAIAIYDNLRDCRFLELGEFLISLSYVMLFSWHAS